MTDGLLCNRVNLERTRAAYANLGYKFFTTGDYNLNIFAIRSKDMHANTFNDVIGVAYRQNNNWVLRKYDATTDAGLYYREHPMNIDGTALVAPGQYRGVFKLGKHKGQYTALVQAKPLLLYRDANRDDVLEYVGEPSWQMAGINLHRANANLKSKLVDRWSGGCLVIADPQCFNEFINICQISADIFGNSFTLTLFTEDEYLGF